jgi:exosortase A-associated hydrolase 2
MVYVHPFAEEMNKARRMAALQSRAFAEAGYAVLQIDLLGCGDSSGDFGDATWEDWIEDVVEASRWMSQRYPRPLWLWGLRAGCLLVSEAARRSDTASDLLFWQPIPAGKTTLQQFLRLKAASEMADAQSKGLIARLRARLDAGEAVEIAGYRLSSALATGLEGASLAPPSDPRRIVWIEVSTQEGATLRPGSAAIVEHWNLAGHAVIAQVVRGAAFWQTSEIEEVPGLIAATLAGVAETASA